jgi:hypothetical protein
MKDVGKKNRVEHQYIIIHSCLDEVIKWLYLLLSVSIEVCTLIKEINIFCCFEENY